MSASRIEDSSSVTLDGVKIINCNVGVRTRDLNVEANDVSFENVRQPWDIENGEIAISRTRISRDPKIISSANKSFVGWSPSHGPAMPAQCPECQTIFPSQNYKISHSRFWSRDNDETCPLCKYEHAKVADGIFDLTEEALLYLSGSDSSLEMLKSAAEITKLLASEEISPKEAISRMKRISPKVANFLKSAAKISFSATMFLAAAITINSYFYELHGTDAIGYVWEELSSIKVILKENLVAVAP